MKLLTYASQASCVNPKKLIGTIWFVDEIYHSAISIQPGVLERLTGPPESHSD